MTESSATDGQASFETVGPPGSPRERRSRPRVLVAGVALAVVAALGAGAYAAYAFLDGGGPQPVDVLPTSTVAVLSLDLDPSAGQKIAALRSLRKFPALKKSLGLNAEDDLREFAFDTVVDQSGCHGLSFHDDVLPWLGKRAALAAVDLGEREPSPVVALQVTDQQEAQKGFQALVDCTHTRDLGFAVGNDYLVASDSAAHARAVLDKGADQPLADDPTYRRWNEAAGDAGVLGFYIAPGAARYGERLFDDLGSNLFDSRGDFSFHQSAPSDAATGGDGSAVKDFQGLGGTVRFSDGGMELSVVGGGTTSLGRLTPVGTQVGELPADTAAALGMGGGNDLAQQLIDLFGVVADVVGGQDGTGADLADDVRTLLGNAATLSLGGTAPRSLSDVSGPDDVPVGLVLHGDAAKIKQAITRIEDRLGLRPADVPVQVQDSGDKVAVSMGGYGAELLRQGSLGKEAGFRDAVPEADKAGAILYVDFNSPWRDALARELTVEGGRSAADFDDNTVPLRALGLSSWQDGDVFHALLEVTTD